MGKESEVDNETVQDEVWIVALMAAEAPNDIRALITEYNLNIEHVRELKKKSLDHIYTDIVQAEVYATAAYKLSQYLCPKSFAIGQWAMGNVILLKGEYGKSLVYYEPAYDYFSKHQNTHELCNISEGYIAALAYTDRIAEALNLATFITTENANTPHNLYNNMGIILRFAGRYEDALFAYDQALYYAQTDNLNEKSARIQHNRAGLLVALNLPERALHAFSEAEPVLIQHRTLSDLARLYSNWGILYTQLGRYEEADHKFSQSISYISDKTSGEFALLTFYQTINKLTQCAYPDDDIVAQFQHAHILLKKIGRSRLTGNALLALVNCHRLREEWSIAKRLCAELNDIVQEDAGRLLAWRVRLEQGKLALAQSRTDEAITHLHKAVEDVEQMRESLSTTLFRSMFHADKTVVFDALAQIYLNEQRLEDAFTIQERIRARLLSEQLYARLEQDVSEIATTSNHKLQAEASQLQDLLGELHTLQKQNFKEQVKQDFSNGDHDLGEQIKEKEKKVGRLIRQIERSNPRFSPLATGFVADMVDIQALLPEDAVVLYYHLIDTTLHLMVIDHNGIMSNVILGEMDAVEQQQMELDVALSRAIDSIAHVPTPLLTKIFPSLLSNTQRRLAMLYEQLITPINDTIVDKSHLIVVPVGRLFYVPFHALFDAKTEQYALEQWEISYTPSTTVTHLCQQQRNHSNRSNEVFIAGCNGGNLLAVEDELNVVNTIFPSAYVDSDADVPSVSKNSVNKRIIHLASHAHFRYDNPMLSSFKLSDRDFTLAEISQLSLDAELVTLSGCETGRSRLQGTDMLSLASGFMAAGAQSLLVSLWQAHDTATAMLMKQFYCQLTAGASRVSALRSAQLQLLNYGRNNPNAVMFQHPAWWAAFTLLGNWQPLTVVKELENKR